MSSDTDSPEQSMPPVEWRSRCAVSCALDLFGDKWSLLIIRDLILHESRTYSEFRESPEHISTNILANRLKLLNCLGVIRRVNPEGFSRGNAYELSEKGLALKPVVLAYGEWAVEHLKEFNDEITMGRE